MSIWGDRVVREGSPVRRTTMYPSRMRCSLMLLLSGLFTAGGVYMVTDLGRGLSGIAVSAFFGLCTAFCLWRLVSGRPVLVVDERGISHATSITPTRFLPWTEIERVYEHRAGVGQTYVLVDLRDGAPSARREGILARLNRMLVGGNMQILTTMLPLPVEDVLGEIGKIAPNHVDVMGRSRHEGWWK
jgi:hypothetical protein